MIKVFEFIDDYKGFIYFVGNLLAILFLTNLAILPCPINVIAIIFVILTGVIDIIGLILGVSYLYAYFGEMFFQFKEAQKEKNEKK